MNSMSWLTFPSSQSRINFFTENCFSGTSNSFSESHFQINLLCESGFEDIVFDGNLPCCVEPGHPLKLPDLMFSVELTSASNCDLKLCVDIVQKSGSALIFHNFKGRLKLLFISLFQLLLGLPDDFV